MPRFNYTVVPEFDLGGGIDQQSAENKIQPGYVEDALNADPKPTGEMVKRAGYQGYAGNIPIRVKEIEQANNVLTFIFDTAVTVEGSAINLDYRKRSPIIVHGRTTDVGFPNTDFATETTRYYDTFTAEIRTVIPEGTTTVDFENAENGLVSNYFALGSGISTSAVDNSNEQFRFDEVRLDKATNDIELDADNNTGAALQSFIYAKDKTPVTGEVYVGSDTTALGTVAIPADTASTIISIPAVQHNLNTNSILTEVYADDGTTLTKITDSAEMTISNDGTVTAEFDTTGAAGFDALFILTAVPATQVQTGTVANGATQNVTIDISGQDSTPFILAQVYLEPTIGATTLERVYPNLVAVDETAGTVEVEFVNNSGVAANFEIYYEFADIRVNRLSVVSDTAGSVVDTTPQLTIWGLDHSELYTQQQLREGWSNHIDSYRSVGEERLITGLGGNIFENSNDAATYLLPTLLPSITARLSADAVVAPAFQETGNTPGRTRGYITGTTVDTNKFEVTTVSYNSGTGYVDYLLSVPNLLFKDNLDANITVDQAGLDSIIDTSSVTPDQITFEQCGLSIHNGTFKIKDATVDALAETITISVENSRVTDADYDEADVGGLAGIFTDQFTTVSGSPFIAGDILLNELFENNQVTYTVQDTLSDVTVISGIESTLNIPAGLRITAQRTSSVIPLRDEDRNVTVENFVRGDMITYTGLERQFRVLNINSRDSESVTIVGDGSTATVTLPTDVDGKLYPGMEILITETASYNGTHVITDVPGVDTIQFASTATTSESGTLIGKTIEIDEELQYSDTLNNSNLFSVPLRWVPIEKPDDEFELTPSNRTTTFQAGTYTNQDFLRSAMVSDNMYFTNGNDEVMKYDGQSVYRAGLFRWQPGAFLTVDTTGNSEGGAAATIPVSTFSADYSSVSNSVFVFTTDSTAAESFREGDKVQSDADDAFYTVTRVDIGAAGGQTRVAVNRTITGGATGTLAKVAVYKYYFRLNAVDANNNLVASAVTGSEDFSISTGVDAAVHIELIGMPAWDIYDYDRLEVQIYRTLADGNTFYRLTTLPLSFNQGEGYIRYKDTDSDETLASLPLDEISTAIAGSELPLGITNPLRAKYVTSASNKLVLGNVKSYPQATLQFVSNNNVLNEAVYTDVDNREWLFRKDNTDTATDTDMVNRAKYVFMPTTSGALIIDTISGDGSTATVTTTTAHGLTDFGTTLNWVYIYHITTDTNHNTSFAGWHQVTSTPNSFTFTFNSTETGTATVDHVLVAPNRNDIPVPIGTDGNYGMENGNLAVANYTSRVMRRLADAINASMRQPLLYYTISRDFTPWLVANAGSEFGGSRIEIRQPKTLNTNFEIQLPALSGDFTVFGNEFKRVGGASVGAETLQFPSRLIASAASNYAEIFDNPTATLDTESLSAIDVNSADGQEITAVIPFFGEAAFGAAQKSAVVVVFKTESIYLVDLAAKEAGQNAVQRLESQGKGCTLPYSVASTRNGIIFANNSGIYRLNRDLTVEYIGRKYERRWLNGFNSDYRGIAQGHNDIRNNKYKLSYPVSDAIQNSEVAVYNHTREYETRGGSGSWTTYDSHNATGWANFDDNAFFGSTLGRVLKIRRTGTETDFRDDSSPIYMEFSSRAISHDAPALRKAYRHIITHYRTEFLSNSTSLSTAVNLADTFSATDAVKISKDTGRKLLTVNSSLAETRGNYLQVKYVNDAIDEGVEITGFDVEVAGLTTQGNTEAANT